MAKGYASSSRSSRFVVRFRALSMFLSLLILYALLLAVIIKKYAHSQLDQISWTYLLGVPISLSGILFITAITIDCLIAPIQANTSLLAARSFLLQVPVSRLDFYHELSVFRDSLLVIIYLFFLAFGVAISFTQCDQTLCHTPYQLLSIGISAINFIRVIHLIFHHYYSFKPTRSLCKEVRHYQEYLDDNRIFNKVLPDVGWNSRLIYLDLITFGLSLGILILTTMWVSDRDCAITCPRWFWCSTYLMFGLWGQEIFLAASEIFLAYFYRVSGVKDLKELATRLQNDKLRAIRSRK